MQRALGNRQEVQVRGTAKLDLWTGVTFCGSTGLRTSRNRPCERGLLDGVKLNAQQAKESPALSLALATPSALSRTRGKG